MTVLQDEVKMLLHGPGESLQGYEGDIADIQVALSQLGVRKPFCLVRDWRVIEVNVDDEYRKLLATDGLSPFVLYAHQVVMHSWGRRQQGDWVRSTFQQSIIEGGFFESVNTVYVLLGSGVMTKGSGQAVLAIGQSVPFIC